MVEHRVVDSTVVTFQHVLHSREVVESIEGPRCRVRRAFSKTGDVPNPDGLIHRGGNYEIFLRVELGGHNVVRMAGEDGYTVPRCAVPNSNGLVVGS